MPQPLLSGQHVMLIAEYITSGGTRTYTQRMLEFYQRHGVNVTFVSYWGASDDSEMQSMVRELGFQFTTYSTIMRKSNAVWKPSVWSYRRMRKERQAFSAFATSVGIDMTVISAGTPGLLAGASGATPRSLYILHTYPHGYRQRYLGRPYLSRFFAKGTGFIAVSDFERRRIVKFWGRSFERRTRVVYSTTGPTRPPNCVDAESPDETSLTVLTVAGLVHYKQPLLWIEVAKQVIERLPWRQVQFLWLGEGPLLADAQRLAMDSEHGARIQFLGLTTDVESFYSQADIYLQLSSIETLGLSALDAQRFGVPSVVTRVGGLPEVVLDGITGCLVSPLDIGEAVDALVHLAEAPRLRRIYSDAAQRHYACKFDPERWNAEMLEAHL